jgi:hypothetical protein
MFEHSKLVQWYLLMQPKHRPVYRMYAPLLAVAMFLVFASCDQSDGTKSGVPLMKRTDIIAGYGEKSFPEKYHLRITLPMPEADFIALLDHLKLHYGVCGERGVGAGLPPPRQQSKVDLSKAQKCYEIDGDRDPVRHTGEAWRAFTDKDHRVIYIENVFAYTGP